MITQVYAPDPAAVGQYITDACEELAARGWEVVVYTSARGYDDPRLRYPVNETRHGVTICRLPFSSFGKRSILIRLAAQLLFLTQACVRAMFAGRVSAVLVSTSPPFAGFFGAIVSSIKRAPLTWWVMDLNPDQMIAAGRVTATSLVAHVFDWMNRVTLRTAHAVIVLDDYMQRRVVAKLPPEAQIVPKVHVIPPWALDRHLPPADGREFRALHRLEQRFVVMYAGNHTEQNPLDTLLAAADALADRTDVVFVFVGGGIGKREVDQRIAAGQHNIVSLPYQPIEALAASLAAADLHVVSVGDAVVGIVHPCKIYSAMAIGRPVLAFGPAESHVADILDGGNAGWHVRHGAIEAAVTAIKAAAAMPRDALAQTGVNAARIVAQRFSRAELLDRFIATLEARPDGVPITTP